MSDELIEEGVSRGGAAWTWFAAIKQRVDCQGAPAKSNQDVNSWPGAWGPVVWPRFASVLYILMGRSGTCEGMAAFESAGNASQSHESIS